MPYINKMSLLAVDIGKYMSNTDSFGERLADAGIMIIMGLSTVFAVLIIIWAALSVMRIFTYDIPNKRKAAKEAEKNNADADTASPAQEETASDEAAVQDDTELIAVITAAIAASEEKSVSSIRVVSFRRAGAPHWNER